MCLILCAFKAHPRFDLIVAANRDEFLDRPARAASWWGDAPWVLGGRDLEKMGTWLGCTRTGRFAAVTNVREPGRELQNAPSRGELVAEFLKGGKSPEEFLEQLRATGRAYNGYNLLFGIPGGEAGSLAYYSNRENRPEMLAPGIYGISNHLLDTPWPKVRYGKARFEKVLDGNDDVPASELFTILSDRTTADDDELPSTGLSLELERMASAICTVGEEYGTRCSTVLMIDKEGKVQFEERDILNGGARRYRFELASGR